MTLRDSQGIFAYEPDPVLAEIAKRLGLKAPLEEIVETLAYPGKGDGPVVVARLACGHRVRKKAGARRMRCRFCQKIIDDGGDYEGFRHSKRNST